MPEGWAGDLVATNLMRESQIYNANFHPKTPNCETKWPAPARVVAPLQLEREDVPVDVAAYS